MTLEGGGGSDGGQLVCSTHLMEHPLVGMVQPDAHGPRRQLNLAVLTDQLVCSSVEVQAAALVEGHVEAAGQLLHLHLSGEGTQAQRGKQTKQDLDRDWERNSEKGKELRTRAKIYGG